MPKLKFPARALIEKIAGRGAELAHQSKELFTIGLDSELFFDKQSDSNQSEYPQNIDGQSNLNNLPRAVPIQRTPSFSPWIGADFFICISVKEAIDLCPSVPMRPATCDR